MMNKELDDLSNHLTSREKKVELFTRMAHINQIFLKQIEEKYDTENVDDLIQLLISKLSLVSTVMISTGLWTADEATNICIAQFEKRKEAFENNKPSGFEN